MLKSCLLVCALLCLIEAPAPAAWHSVGPYGGTARALTYNPAAPDQVPLGTAGGSLFESDDFGSHWHPFAHLGSNDLMLKTIIFDRSQPRTIFVAGWGVSGVGGGFFVSHDGGRSWSEPAAELKGKSIQALAQSASDPRVLVAAALDGLYRSRDSGNTWSLITPLGNPRLKNFESVAIDPRDSQVIYAGTWHLPWKTRDGGTTWINVRHGVIDDSDVFSVILDRSNPDTVFASACSGIYKSENGGRLFHKVQGIPGAARRTRILQQDPNASETVYAGTTEGLYKTVDGGAHFQRMTPASFILNDVLVDPRDSNRVLIATDRGGIFASTDGGATFSSSNDGFSERQISSIVADPSGDVYVGTLNDKEFGGVFRFHAGDWAQASEGLAGRDVFALGLSPHGQLVAGTSRGIFLFNSKQQAWQLSGDGPAAAMGPGAKSRIWSLALADSHWYAATDAGMLRSEDEGESWTVVPITKADALFSVSAHDRVVAASGIREVWYSQNFGQHWTRLGLPAEVTRVYAVTVTSSGDIWASTRAGALRWTEKDDKGSWEHVLGGLPMRDVTSIRESGGVLLAAGADSNTVYVSVNRGTSWTAAESAAPFEVTGGFLAGKDLYLTTKAHGAMLQQALAPAPAQP